MSAGFSLADIDRRLASVLRFGTVVAVDAAAARVRVSFGGETESAWLQFGTGRAGGARVWAPPVVGEQVFIGCPQGDTGQGVILASLPSAAYPPPSSDGAAYRIDLPGGVSLLVSGGGIAIVAPSGLQITGDVTVTGDVIADGISLKTHVHGGVVPGSGNSGEPEG